MEMKSFFVLSLCPDLGVICGSTLHPHWVLHLTIYFQCQPSVLIQDVLGLKAVIKRSGFHTSLCPVTDPVVADDLSQIKVFCCNYNRY